VTRLTQFENDGLTFDVLDAGPEDGEVVVLLHGFPERAACWDAVAARLHAEGYRTLAPDQRGYSPRARPKGRRAYAVPHLVGDVEALLAAATAAGARPGPVHLVGHDWGAIVAWATAAQRPHLVRSLVTVSVAHPAAFMGAMVRSNQVLRSWYVGFFQLPLLPERVVGRSLGERLMRHTGMTDAEVATFQRDVVEYGALPGGIAWYRALPFVPRGWIGRRVTVPTSHVWSEGDVALARVGSERTERYVDAPYSLHVLPGSHWLPEQQPDALADIVLERARSVEAPA
jgi:pimeloyl-ACP methyl ester carboxylesterase